MCAPEPDMGDRIYIYDSPYIYRAPAIALALGTSGVRPCLRRLLCPILTNWVMLTLFTLFVLFACFEYSNPVSIITHVIHISRVIHIKSC
jgi:hypothetical protein